MVSLIIATIKQSNICVFAMATELCSDTLSVLLDHLALADMGRAARVQRAWWIAAVAKQRSWNAALLRSIAAPRRPQFVAPMPDGAVVTGRWSHRLHLIGTNGDARTVGSFGDAPLQFNTPKGVACDGNHLFVIDEQNQCIKVITVKGPPCCLSSTSLSSSIRKCFEEAVRYDRLGVSSTLAPWVHAFLSQPEATRSFQLGNAAIDNGQIFVLVHHQQGPGSDLLRRSRKSCVLVFSVEPVVPDGALGLRGCLLVPGDARSVAVRQRHLYLTTGGKHAVRIFELETSGADLAHTADCYLSTPRELYHFGRQGSSPGEFNGPEGIAIVGACRREVICIADSLNRRVQVCSFFGKVLQILQPPSAGPILACCGCARGADSQRVAVWVADGGADGTSSQARLHLMELRDLMAAPVHSRDSAGD